jgi:hypothetical protein
LRLTIVLTDENASLTENREAITDKEHALDSIRDMFAALRACRVPPLKDEARHGMEYTIRFALKRDGTMIAAPRMTYSSHEVSAATRDVYRDAIARAWLEPLPAARSSFALWMTVPLTNNTFRDDGLTLRASESRLSDTGFISTHRYDHGRPKDNIGLYRLQGPLCHIAASLL